MKKIIYILFVLAMVTLNITGCNAQPNSKVNSEEFKTIILYINSPIMVVNDTEIELDSAPVIKNNHILVPMSAVMEHMETRVEWNNENQTISVYDSDNTVDMTINSEIAYLNNKKYVLDSPPIIINSRIFIPIRFISEGFDFSVDWYESLNKITITSRKIIHNKDINTNTQIIGEINSSENITWEKESDSMISINIKIGSSDFSAKLYDNTTVRELIKEFPVTYNMSELHGNEKYYYMSNFLPTDSKVLDNINKGEIMLYGSDCLVVFYDTFPNSYSYTRLGYIEDTSGLENALGIGNVDISFELQ